MRTPRPVPDESGREPASDGLRVSRTTALRETHTRLIAAPAKSSRGPDPKEAGARCDFSDTAVRIPVLLKLPDVNIRVFGSSGGPHPGAVYALQGDY